MKCPTCGQELTPSKNDPNYLLCYNCKKKYKVSDKVRRQAEEEEANQAPEQKYSNVPPERVRRKTERDAREGYDEMVNAGAEEDENLSRAPIIILGIAIAVVVVLIIVVLLM